MSRYALRNTPKLSSRGLSRAFATNAPSIRIQKLLDRKAPVDIHPEVLDALQTKKPVVALETALVTHGFPSPENYALASSLEDIVRSAGSIPATIAIIGGRVKIGLNKNELERICQAPAVKISRRDIGAAIASKANGGTTICGTTVFAAAVGIKVFATGGLGGVHRGGELSMDVSADLGELARCPVGVVSSGVKSILDIGRTLEYLETLGVPVINYGPTREFPAFFSPRSGHYVPWNVEEPISAARILYSQWQMGMDNGALITVPIPQEYEAAGLEIQKAVDHAVAESEQNGISKSGKDATPWLLNRVGELTKGESLNNNIALLKNTALVGGQIAVQYEKLLEEQDARNVTINHTVNLPPATASPSPLAHEQSNVNKKAKLIVIGASAVDITASRAELENESLSVHSTVPGSVSVSLGGVARNIAEAASRVMSEDSVLLVTPIGNDSFGALMSEETKKLGMRDDGFIVQDQHRTSTCNMILDGMGNLITGIADMGITENLNITKALDLVVEHKPTVIGFDGNLSPGNMTAILRACKEHKINVLFEPTSLVKCTRILEPVASTFTGPGVGINFMSPNLLELSRIYQVARNGPLDLLSQPKWWKVIDDFSLGSQFRTDLEHLARMDVSNTDVSRGTLSFLLDQGVAQQALNLLPFFQHITIKCGEKGVIVVMRVSESTCPTSSWLQEISNIKDRYIVSQGNSSERVVLAHYPALPVDKVVNVTGAGDSFVGAILAGLVDRPDSFSDPDSMSKIITLAQQAAILTLSSEHAVSPKLSDLNV
ncbi:hypothetical protein K435DRAFT_959796 [Dendrothele bispora CBS 962.96]|uniref:Carbohydrate kinase PfkB domain-containing protein n=1 Tax=Dendrothele bispora (strain CBS 962.96) TaxID=1314807 RepID=A0A4V4HIT0_DENBC|nr:hypothetical protein K435DRAFT_959796 [Dendrothele bispora CBS 962.96]